MATEVPLMNPLTHKFTGEKLSVVEASQYIACLEQRVADLEGELARHQIEVDDFYRADQHCVCKICSKTYGEHPYGGQILSDRSMILHRLCNGELVKL